MKMYHPTLQWYLEKNRSQAYHMICRKPWVCYPRNVECGCGMSLMHQEWWRHWNESCGFYNCPDFMLPTEYNEQSTMSVKV